jgi:hypothetical protein
MKKILLAAALFLSSAHAYCAQGQLTFGFGVEREGVDLALDYTLAKTSFESYKTFLRYQGSSMSSLKQNLMLGFAAGVYANWGPYSASILPGATLNLIEDDGLAFGPSLELGVLCALDSVISVGFSKFDNWIWVGKKRGFCNSCFLLNFKYKL